MTTNVLPWLLDIPGVVFVEREPDPPPVVAEMRHCKDCGVDVDYNKVRCVTCKKIWDRDSPKRYNGMGRMMQ